MLWNLCRPVWGDASRNAWRDMRPLYNDTDRNNDDKVGNSNYVEGLLVMKLIQEDSEYVIFYFVR